LNAAQVEADETHDALDDAKDRFDGLLAPLVKLFGIFGLQLGFHRDAPGLGDPPGRFGLGRRRTEVVRPVRLGPPDRHQRFDATGLQLRHRRAAGEAGISQDRLG
jgi:hypothetical protein